MHIDGLEHKEPAASSSFTVSSDIQLLAILGETPVPLRLWCLCLESVAAFGTPVLFTPAKDP